MKKKIIEILYKYTNPYGYRLVGEDSFENIAKEIIELYKLKNGKEKDKS